MIRFLFVLLLVAAPSFANPGRILVQSTTSTENSGLYAYLLPIFEKQTGYDVQVVAVGTGQAIRNAENGDADVLLVHARAREDAFVAAGHGLARRDLMYNDFILVGPAHDPAGVKSARNIGDALQRIAGTGSLFVSRGDDSGTHTREQSLWSTTGIDPSGPWYRETGSGMGATIRMAVEIGGYTLSDRATWLSFGAKSDTQIVFEGDPALFNQYGIIVLNPERHPHVNLDGAQAFSAWLLGPEGQAAIASFRVNGEKLFVPNATAG